MMLHQGFHVHTRRNSFYTNVFRVLVIGLYLSGCTYPSVPPTQGVALTFPVLPTSTSTIPLSPSDTPTNTPIIATLTSAPSMTSPPTPSCGAPAGWVRYTIRPGDNLFRLGLKTGATVDDIKLANCLTSDDIRAGDPLFLPFIPPIDTQIPPQPTVIARCPSSFNCSDFSLPPIPIAPGGPNDPGFKPCSTSDGLPKGFPWISVETENNLNIPIEKRNDLEQGQRQYYYACEFPDPGKLMAQISGPAGIQALTVLSTIPNLDLQMYEAQRVVVWNPTCDFQTGENAYTLKIWDGNGSQAELTFSLKAPMFQRILTTPYQSRPAGTTFQVYYCGYGAVAGKEIVVDFYYGVKRTDGREGYDFFHADSWNVLINANGWAVQSLQSLSGDIARAYLIRDNDPALEGFDLIWLSP